LFQKGGRQTKEKFSSLSSFLDTEAITQRKKEYRVLFTATRSIAQTNALRERERERERDEEIAGSNSEEKNSVVIFSKISSSSSSNAARGNQQRRGRTKTRERLTDDGAKEMEQRTRSIVRRKFSEQCSF
jgi:hypothetical protein